MQEGKNFQNSRGATVIADTNEHLDKEMWGLLEDLRVQNRLLLEENSALRTLPPVPPEEEQNLLYEVDKLKQQLKVALESKASEINEDNLRLLNTFVEVRASQEVPAYRMLALYGTIQVVPQLVIWFDVSSPATCTSVLLRGRHLCYLSIGRATCTSAQLLLYLSHASCT